MGFLSKFEGKMEDTVEGAAERLGGASISPVQIAKKAEKQMRRGKVVGAGKQFAPTLYTVLVCPEDDATMFNYYPTIAGETETFLLAKAAELGLAMDGHPLVRFIADDQLKRGKFDVVAELVAAQIVERLRADEMARYGISPQGQAPQRGRRAQVRPMNAPEARQQAPHPYEGGPGSLVPLTPEPPFEEPDMDPEFGYDPSTYDPDYDEIHSANIAEPDYYPVPAPQSAPQPTPQSTPAPASAPRAASAAEPAGLRMPMPETGLREVYLYDEARDCAYQLTGAPERMGRESSNSIIIPDINASRVHAEIRCEPTGAWIITDLGSLNGVFVNGRRIKSAPLRDADMIRIGTTELEFQDLEQ